MFQAIFQRYKEAGDRHIAMQQKYPRVELVATYAIAEFKIPAIQVTQGVATVSDRGQIIEEVREDYFICLPLVGTVLGVPQTRFDHAWRRHRKGISDWDMNHRKDWARVFSRYSLLYIHQAIDFKPMVKDMAVRRPYHPSLDAIYNDVFPSDRLGRRRKNYPTALNAL